MQWRISGTKSRWNRDSITEQIEKLNEFVPDSILTDREYKSTTNRMSLNYILDVLRPNDVLVTTKLSNIGRTYREIFGYWKEIADKGAYIVVLGSPAVDTRPRKQGAGDTAAEFLSYLMSLEENRISKVAEGMAAAKTKGITPGPKRKIPSEFYEMKKRWQNHEISSREAAKILDISGRTFLRWVKS